MIGDNMLVFGGFGGSKWCVTARIPDSHEEMPEPYVAIIRERDPDQLECTGR
jgi:hypothetical protein